MKPTILEQIEFIAGARKLVDCDSIVELDAKNFEMLKAIEENLTTLRIQQHVHEKMQTKIVFDESKPAGFISIDTEGGELESEKELDEVKGDYNRHEEAERQHRIQRDLK